MFIYYSVGDGGRQRQHPDAELENKKTLIVKISDVTRCADASRVSSD